ncbi:hypothetical protein [Pseudomonas sp. HS6]|uniref:hypothetical protein n=1 Tax=Pseudomonas sp. HS6 TaxID=2850559 RepID=UPI002018B4E7|nr:hypothetical protein [Pseudomonas sp. HS6]UQS15179.1 hypothetical protein JJN09_28930 [Pseudomonas sp. HS6]
MPSRKRPKTLKRNIADHHINIRRWKRWLPGMKRDLSDLLSKRETFWELQEVANENPKIMNPYSFFDWMCRNYVVSQAIGIRSFIDQSRDSRSLWRMLYEMLENPGIINRENHVRMYGRTQIGPELGHMTFNNVVGKGRSHLAQQATRSDLRVLEDASERVKRFVNKRIAHRTSPGELRRLPKFDELDMALQKLDEIFCKYNLLLTGEGISSLHAVRQFNWRDVLLEPWILKGSKLHPDT